MLIGISGTLVLVALASVLAWEGRRDRTAAALNPAQHAV
jgi:hypothetical protein